MKTTSFINTEMEMDRKINDALSMLQVSEFADQHVEDLPYGIQRRIEIARALCLDPMVLLLDEPTAGLNPKEAEQIVEIISYLLNELSVSMVVIEHNMRIIMNICSRIVVMNQGQVIATGTPEEIQKNKEVIRVYLGEKRSAR
jgi:branched-chain amino acid transport system ATP-binding protein